MAGMKPNKTLTQFFESVYNGLGIISFHKDGVLTGSRMLWKKFFVGVYGIRQSSE
jgi:hypothetical protein